MILRLLALSLSLCFALPAQEAKDIMLGTWNIEFLGADPKYRRDTPSRAPDDYVAIGRKVRDLGVAVLGVQEICGEAPLRLVARSAGPTWRAVLGTSGQWSDGKTQQGVGFLYDTDVLDLVHAEELLDFPSELDGVSVFHRKPVTAALRHRGTGSDFRIVVVHLKAGRKARDKQKRKAEATHLRAWVDSLLADPNEDHDIVILGDFNCSYGDAPETVLERGDVMRYVEHAKPGPTIMHFDTPIDQFCATRSFGELQSNSLTSHHVVGDKARLAFRKTYSDHFPVTARMTPLADDDPKATFRRGPAAQVLPTTRRANTAAGQPRRKAAAATWPPKPGALVEVLVDGRVRKGVLVHMPVDRGWVVIDPGNGVMAFPMHKISWVHCVPK